MAGKLRFRRVASLGGQFRDSKSGVPEPHGMSRSSCGWGVWGSGGCQVCWGFGGWLIWSFSFVCSNVCSGE